MIAVEGLEVQVKHNADKASTSIEKLVQSMNNLRHIARIATDSLRDFSHELKGVSDYSAQAKTNLSGFTKEIKKHGDSFRRATQEAVKYAIVVANFKQFTMTDPQVPSTAFANRTYADYYRRNFNPLLLGNGETSDPNIIDVPYREIESSVENTNYIIRNIKDEEAESLKKIKEIKKEASEIEKIAKKLNSINLTKKFNETLKNISKIPRKVISSFLRIGAYRAVRFVWSELTGVIKEGLENAYRFSQFMGGEFYQVMDSLTSLNNQFKNQVGSAFSELVIMIKPWLDSLLRKAIDIANTISMVFAHMNGDTFYKKANSLSDSWKEATASAKAYKTQVLGIDELNILDDNKSSGGGSNGNDYSDLYTYAKVDENKATQIEKALQNAIELAKQLGLTILGIKLSTDLAKFISFLMENKGLKGALSDLIKKNKLTIGIGLAITGFSIEAMGAYSIGRDGINIKNALQTIIGGALGVAVMTMAFGATGFIIGLPLSIVIATIAIQKGVNTQWKNEFYDSEVGKNVLHFSKDFDEAYANGIELIANIESIVANASSADTSQLEVAKELIEDIFNLDEIEIKTPEQIDLIKLKIETLNSLGLDGVHAEFDDLNQKVIGVKDSLLEQIDVLKQEYQAEAFAEAYKEAYAEQIKALDEVIKAEENRNAIQKEYDGIKKQIDYYNQLDAKVWEVSNAMADSYMFDDEKYRKCADELNRLTDEKHSINITLLQHSFGEMQDVLDEENEKLEELNTEYENAKKAVESLDDTFVEFSKTNGKVRDGIDEITSNSNEAKDAVSNLGGSYDALKESNDNIIASIQEVTASLKAQREEAERAQEALRSNANITSVMPKSNSVQKYANGGIIQRYADGGITHGQLFVANEGNSPEMIGAWGSQSAVANTDQIVNGIQSGVSSAVASVLAPYLSQIANNTRETANKNFSVNIGDREIAKANNRGQKQLGKTLVIS